MQRSLKSTLGQVKPDTVVGHNHLGFDLEALRKCWNCDYSVGRQSKFLGRCFLCGYLLAESVPQSGSRGATV